MSFLPGWVHTRQETAPAGLRLLRPRTSHCGATGPAPLDQNGGDGRPADGAVPRMSRGERLPALETDAAVAALHDDRVLAGDAAHVAEVAS